MGPYGFDIGGDAGDQPAAADGHEDGMQRAGVLAQNFHRDGALAGDNFGIVIGVDVGHAAFLGERQGAYLGFVIGIAVQHRPRAPAPRRNA